MKPIIINLEPEGYSKLAADKLEKYFEYRVLSPDKVLEEEISEVVGIITRLGFNLTREFLSRLPNLRFVATATTGVNHVDQEYMEEIGGKVISLKGETDFLDTITPTAEHAWGLLIALIRNYKSAFDSVEKYRWNRDLFHGERLRGKKLGIIGMGRLGRMMAKYGIAFEMNVVFYDNKDINFERAQQVSLSELLSTSDVVSIHLPLLDSTFNFFSYHEISLMKSSAFLINTARGEVLNEEALIWGLEEGEISGAALDVLAGEVSWGTSIPDDNRLIAYAKCKSNLIITPHIGGACPEVMRLTEDFICDKVLTYSKKENIV